jgi:hypothetical protein
MNMFMKNIVMNIMIIMNKVNNRILVMMMGVNNNNNQEYNVNSHD